MQTAVLFDLDGVIVDTEPQYSFFWSEIGKRYFPEMPDFSLQIKGRTLLDIFERFFPAAPHEQDVIQKALTRFERTMTFTPVPGAFEFVENLRNEGVKTAVVTSSDRNKMSCLYHSFPDFNERFDRIFTAEDSPRPKPFPDCYLLAARRLGLEAKDCFIFEDSPNGLTAARQSGAKVIGLTTSLSAAEIAERCDLYIPDFTHITTAELDRLMK